MPEAIAPLRAKGITCLAAALYQSQPLSAAEASYPGGGLRRHRQRGAGPDRCDHCRLQWHRPHPHDGPGGKPERGHRGQHPAVAFPGGEPVSGPGLGQTSLYPAKPAPEPLLCWLWLSWSLGAGSGRAGQVLDAFGGAQEAWEARETAAFRQAMGKPAAERANQPDNTPLHYRAYARRCAARGIRILPYDDPDYPLAFSRIPDMPLVLYCTGDPRWLNEPAAVGMVGTRNPSEYGRQAADDLGSALAKAGAILVSGLADGLDSAGHRAAVRENAPPSGCWASPSTAPTRPPTGSCAAKWSRRAASSASTRLRPSRWAATAFCSATASLRPCPVRAGGGGSPGEERHHVHRGPCRAVRQARFRRAGQHLLAQKRRDERPAARGAGQGRLSGRGPLWGAGAEPHRRTARCAQTGPRTLKRQRAPGAGLRGQHRQGRRGTGRGKRPAHGAAAGHIS